MQSPLSYSPSFGRQTGYPCLAAINYAMSAPAPKPLEVKFLSALETICLEELLQASPLQTSFASCQCEALSIEGARGALWCANPRKVLWLGLQSLSLRASGLVRGRASSTHFKWPQRTSYSRTFSPHSSHPVVISMQTLASAHQQLSVFLW